MNVDNRNPGGGSGLLKIFVMFVAALFMASSVTAQTPKFSFTEREVDYVVTLENQVESDSDLDRLYDVAIAEAASILIASIQLSSSTDPFTERELQVFAPYMATGELEGLPISVVSQELSETSIRTTVSVDKNNAAVLPRMVRRDEFYGEMLSIALKNPRRFSPDFYLTLGLPDLAVLFEQQRLFDGLRVSNYPRTNINPVYARRSFIADLKSEGSQLELLRRWPGETSAVSILLKDNVVSDAESVAVRSLACLDTASQFVNFLAKLGVYVPSDLRRRSGFVDSLNLCGGFVKFESGSPPRSDSLISLVKRNFEQGRDLQQTTELLEVLAFRQPDSAFVWEYLAAAYEAQGLHDDALLAARLWAVQDVDNAEAILNLLKALKLKNLLPKHFHNLI